MSYTNPTGSSVLLGQLLGANMNSTADQIIGIGASKYIITSIVVTNASMSLTLAVGGFYTAAAKGGTPIVAAVQVYSALTAATKYLAMTLAGILGTDYQTANPLYFALTTVQGAAATADIRIYGYVLAP
jgi:hypothetical protein